MREKLKNYFKFGILFFGIPIFLFGCLKDDVQQSNTIDTNKTVGLKYYRITTETIFKSNKSLENHISKKFSKNKDSFLSRIESEDFGFSIDTSAVQVISSENLNSYTFVVERENPDPNIIENYVYTEFSNGGYTQMIVTYAVVYDGNDITYDIANSSAQYIIEESLLFNRGVTCNNTTEELYNFDENAGECINYDCTAGGGHHVGQQCSGDPDQQPYTECEGAWVVTGCIQFGGSGGTGPSGSTGGGSTTNNGEPEEPEDTPLMLLAPKRECKKVNGLLNNPDNALFKQKLNDLANPANYGQNLDIQFEKYAAIHKNEQSLQEREGNLNQASVDISYINNYANKVTAFVHTHPNDTDGTYSVYSFEDLIAISKILANDKLDTGTFVAYLITKKGNNVTKYALTINNTSKFRDFFYFYNDSDFNFNTATQEQKDKRTDSFQKSEKLRDKYYDQEPQRIAQFNVNSEQMLTEFLKLMDEADMGTTLFEASPSLDGTINNYTSLSLNGNNVVRTQCNN